MRPATFLATLFLLIIATRCWADALDEREHLRQAQVKIAQLQLILDEAESAADPDARIHFRYDWLRRDLEIIRRGIQAHIDAPTLDDDNRTPVRGDYRR
jgi:RAQPRD family integrative conjugative element protein